MLNPPAHIPVHLNNINLDCVFLKTFLNLTEILLVLLSNCRTHQRKDQLIRCVYWRGAETAWSSRRNIKFWATARPSSSRIFTGRRARTLGQTARQGSRGPSKNVGRVAYHPRQLTLALALSSSSRAGVHCPDSYCRPAPSGPQLLTAGLDRVLFAMSVDIRWLNSFLLIRECTDSERRKDACENDY